MDASKKKKISELLGLYNYSLVDLAAYVKRIAPNIKSSAEQAYIDGMNDFLGAALGRDPVEKKATPIPYAEESDRIGRDLWLFLGSVGFTVDDLADYVSETLAERKDTESDKSMQLSQILHAMQTEAQGAQEIFEQAQRLKKESESFNMSSFLSNIPNGF